MRVFFFSFIVYFFCFSFLYSAKRITWMNAEKRHRMFSFALLLFVLSFYLDRCFEDATANAKSRSSRSRWRKKTVSELRDDIECIYIERLISFRFVSSFTGGTTQIYIHNGRSFARVEDNRIRRQISGNLHLMATAFSF